MCSDCYCLAFQYKDCDRRYLLCPAGFTIGLIKKFVRLKFDLQPQYQVCSILCNRTSVEPFSLSGVSSPTCSSIFIYRSKFFTWMRASKMTTH